MPFPPSKPGSSAIACATGLNGRRTSGRFEVGGSELMTIGATWICSQDSQHQSVIYDSIQSPALPILLTSAFGWTLLSCLLDWVPQHQLSYHIHVTETWQASNAPQDGSHIADCKVRPVLAQSLSAIHSENARHGRRSCRLLALLDLFHASTAGRACHGCTALSI